MHTEYGRRRGGKWEGLLRGGAENQTVTVVQAHKTIKCHNANIHTKLSRKNNGGSNRWGLPSATPCPPDYSPITAVSHNNVSVRTKEDPIADNNMEVLLMSKKKPRPKTWKCNDAKDQLRIGV
jgi:hypothetical protein